MVGEEESPPDVIILHLDPIAHELGLAIREHLRRVRFDARLLGESDLDWIKFLIEKGAPSLILVLTERSFEQPMKAIGLKIMLTWLLQCPIQRFRLVPVLVGNRGTLTSIPDTLAILKSYQFVFFDETRPDAAFEEIVRFCQRTSKSRMWISIRVAAAYLAILAIFSPIGCGLRRRYAAAQSAFQEVTKKNDSMLQELKAKDEEIERLKEEINERKRL